MTDDTAGPDPAAPTGERLRRELRAIWTERRPERMADLYAPGAVIFDGMAMHHGTAAPLAEAHHMLGAFPDLSASPEAVLIDSGGDGTRVAQRTRFSGTNDGASHHGPPTGRRIEVLSLSQALWRDGRIVVEHTLQNTAGMMLQLGLDPAAEAARLAADPPPGWPRGAEGWALLRGEGAGVPARGPREAADPGDIVRRLLTGVWGDGGLGVLDEVVAEGVTFEGPTLRKGTGRDDYAAMCRALRLPFGDRRPSIDAMWWQEDDDGATVASRWSLAARHAQDGLYGPPSGAEVHLWGLAEHRLEAGRVVAERMLFNELDLMMQIAAT